MKKTTKKRSVEESGKALERVYRYLPFFLVSMAIGNVYFVIEYVRGERQDLTSVRLSVLRDATNAYYFVEHALTEEIHAVRRALSNEVDRVRYSTDMRLRPLVSRTDGLEDVESKEENKGTRIGGRVRGEPLEGRFFRVGGKSFLDLGNGNYVGVGEDFGLGVVERITPIGVFCESAYYPLVSRSILRKEVKNDVP